MCGFCVHMSSPLALAIYFKKPKLLHKLQAYVYRPQIDNVSTNRCSNFPKELSTIKKLLLTCSFFP
jgi:hypothetical protein